jgi:L-glyceraldehyde 3-phosphate reductase
VQQLQANLDAVALVERIGADDLRRLVEPFWADRDVVDPEGP